MGALLEMQILPQVDHDERSEAQVGTFGSYVQTTLEKGFYRSAQCRLPNSATFNLDGVNGHEYGPSDAIRPVGLEVNAKNAVAQ